MDRRLNHEGGRREVNEEPDVIPLHIMNQSDDSALFIVNDAGWGGTAPSPLLTPRPTNYNQQESVFIFNEDGSLSSCSNTGYQEYQRQDSNLHAPFESDTAFLFSNRKPRRFNAKKRLAAVWCATCVFQIWQYLSQVCTFDCSCRDQSGVHCMYRLKQKAMKKLKVVQGALCVVTTIQSFMIFMPLGTITSDFDGQCLLHSNLFIYWISRNDTVALDLTRTKFGLKEDCNFTTFINVVVTLVSLLFIWFFIHTSFVSGLEHIEVKLQFPFFLCCLVLLVSVIVSSFKITIGFNSWCHNIIMNNPLKTHRQRLKCKDFENLKWSTDNRSTFYTYFVLAEISTWMLVLTLVLQMSVNALQLYHNFTAGFTEIEVPYLKLKNSGESSDDEPVDWELDNLHLSLNQTVAPLPVYKVEYKKHQVLAKVVHRDKVTSPFKSLDANSTFILDKEKFKRNISTFDRLDSLKQKRKIDFPLKVEPGRRRRLNWTGSCEELRSRYEFGFGSQIRRKLAARSREWHGFDTDVNITDENGEGGEVPAWHGDFGSQIHTLWSTGSFEWPAIGHSNRPVDGQVISHEWHGFENDFVSQLKRSSSLPADWHLFDSELENHTTDNFTWSSQNLSTARNRDPWGLEQYHSGGNINDENARSADNRHRHSAENLHRNDADNRHRHSAENLHRNDAENRHSYSADHDERNKIIVFDTNSDPFADDKR